MAPQEAQDPYEVLGVKPSASTEEITKAYKELVVRYHPDRHQGNDLEELAKEKMKKINEAYEVLSDPQLRAAHDAQRGFLGTGKFHRRATIKRPLIARLITLGIILASLPFLMRSIRSPKHAAATAALLVLFYFLPRFIARFRQK